MAAENDADGDYAIALLLQQEFDNEQVSPRKLSSHGTVSFGIVSPGGRVMVPTSQGPTNVVHPRLEVTDPNPDVHELFLQFDGIFFNGALNNRGVEVRWSPRMTMCAGLCVYEGKGGLCSVRLSTPLLKLRPRKDLVETLLHEMIHAFLFITENNTDHDGHGPQFQSHMHRINKMAGTNITIYHSFHNEVAAYRQHWWRCTGPCRDRPPYYGYVKRAMNRAPSPHDPWWADHQQTCGGKYDKVKEPDNYKVKGKGTPFNAIKGKGPQRGTGDGRLNHPKGQQEKGQLSKMVIINGILQKASNGGHATKTDTGSKFPGQGIQLGSCSTPEKRMPEHSSAANHTGDKDVATSGPTSTEAGRTASPPHLTNHSKSPGKITPGASPKAGTKRPSNQDIRDMFLRGGTAGKKVKVSSQSGTDVCTHQQVATASTPNKGTPGSPGQSRAVTCTGSTPERPLATGGSSSGVNVCTGTSSGNPCIIDLTQGVDCVDEKVTCPVCATQVLKGSINEHLDQCLQ